MSYKPGELAEIADRARGKGTNRRKKNRVRTRENNNIPPEEKVNNIEDSLIAIWDEINESDTEMTDIVSKLEGWDDVESDANYDIDGGTMKAISKLAKATGHVINMLTIYFENPGKPFD